MSGGANADEQIGKLTGGSFLQRSKTRYCETGESKGPGLAILRLSGDDARSCKPWKAPESSISFVFSSREPYRLVSWSVTSCTSFNCLEIFWALLLFPAWWHRRMANLRSQQK